jgi:hypothetical protein
MKKITHFIILFVFLCNNCVYPAYLDKETLASKSPFDVSVKGVNDALFAGLIKLVASVNDNDVRRLLLRARDIFAGIFKNDPEAFTILYNKDLKELFLVAGEKLIHIYSDKHTRISSQALQSYNEDILKIDIYTGSEDNISSLRDIKNLIVLEGVDELTKEQQSRTISDHIVDILKSQGVYEEGKSIEDMVQSVTNAHLRKYIMRVLSIIQKTGTVSSGTKVIPAHYASIKNSDSYFGWLSLIGISDLEEYGDDVKENTAKEYRNAVKIRDYIFSNGFDAYFGEGLFSEDRGLRFKLWNGHNGTDNIHSEIIQNNLTRLFRSLPKDEMTYLERSIRQFSEGGYIAIGVLDTSHHWCENCRGDGFIGINRYILEKIIEITKEIDTEKANLNREDEILRLEGILGSLELYLQTYLYHELRHEAFIAERDLLGDPLYENSDIGIGLKLHDMKPADIKRLINTLSPDEMEKFDKMIEQRQNRNDAIFFAGQSKKEYESYLRVLLDLNIIDQDSLFMHAAVIAGLARSIPGELGLPTHCNELIITDFSRLGKGSLAKQIYRIYDSEYTALYQADIEKTKSEERDGITYMLYKVGLTDYVSVDRWREKNDYDRNLAKKYIIRLIDFMSRNQRSIESGSTDFKRLDWPITCAEAAQGLTRSLLASGDFSKAIFRTSLAFKTSGLVNTVTKTRFEFWKLVEEACAEMVARGDTRFKGITAVTMKKANIEREMLPRLRILYLFSEYLLSDLGTAFNRTYRDPLQKLIGLYRAYLRGDEVVFDDDDIKQFDRIYPKAYELLLQQLGLDENVWGDFENNDFLLALWEAFDFAENLNPNTGLYFSEPLIVSGSEGDETRFTKEELSAIVELKSVYDKPSGTIRRVDMWGKNNSQNAKTILNAFRSKVTKYRNGLREVLNRYGSDRDLNGNRFLDLLRNTRGWSSAIWLGREYTKIFSAGQGIRALDIHSGSSVFYKSLSKILMVTENRLSGLADIIEERSMEYFGENPLRFAGDVTSGQLVNMTNGAFETLPAESVQLITSIYKLHNITSPAKMYKIFQSANKMLQYGGHFAITMSPGRRFSEESLAVIREKLGFEPVFVPRVTWNTLEDQRSDSSVLRDLKKKMFYVVVFKKIGTVKEGAEGIEDASILIPESVSVRGNGRVVSIIEDVLPDTEKGVRNIVVNERGLVGANMTDLTVEGIAQSLTEGLAQSAVIKEKAENAGMITEFKNEIARLLMQQITDEKRVRDYLECESRKEIKKLLDKGLTYDDKDYSPEVESELLELLEKLETLKKYLSENIKEFLEKISGIRSRDEYAVKLSSADNVIFNKVIHYGAIDLTDNALREVRDIYQKITAIEKSVKEQTARDDEKKRYIEANWTQFEILQKMVKKYQVIAENYGNKRNVRDVVNAKREELTADLFTKAQMIEKYILRVVSADMAGIPSLEDFDDQIMELIQYSYNDFLFGLNDIEFLNKLAEIWKNDVIPESYTFILSDLKRLYKCMVIKDYWQEVLKEIIDWDQGFAQILRDVNENNYLHVLIKNLLFNQFQGRGVDVYIDHRDQQKAIADIMNIRPKNCNAGEDITLAIPSSFNITADFMEAIYKLGFDVTSMHMAWLELNPKFGISNGDVRAEIERLMRGEHFIFVLNKKRDSEDVDEGMFNLRKTNGVEQSYANWLDSRQILLQEFKKEDFRIQSVEYLTRKQIMELYPKWAERFLGSAEWKGEFFEKHKIEHLAEEFTIAEEQKRIEEERRLAEAKRVREEEERLMVEREVNLIKKSETPIVSISYNELWTGSLVRDLAQLLLHIIKDFENPPGIDVILNNETISLHPQLSVISKSELIAKIQELIVYRQYDLKAGEVYRELGRIMAFMIPMSLNQLNMRGKIDDIPTVVPLIGGNITDGVLRWYEYQLGFDPSPFGLSEEAMFDNIMDNYLALRRFENLKPQLNLSGTTFKVKKGRMVMHFLSDPDGRIKKYGTNIHGLDIETDEDSIMYEYAILNDLVGLLSASKSDFTIPRQEIVKLQNLFRHMQSVFGQLEQVYMKKNLEKQYFMEILKVIKDIYAYVNMTTANIELASNKVAEIIITVEYFTKNVQMLLDGKMTQQEFDEFLREMKQRTNIQGPAVEGYVSPVSRGMNNIHLGGNEALNYYFYKDGGKRRIDVNDGDKVLSRFAEGSMDIQYYFDALYALKGVQLYRLSQEEKDILDRLIEDVLYKQEQTADIQEVNKKIVSFMYSTNTVNRFLYFSHKYLSSIWAQNNIVAANDYLDSIISALLVVEPKIKAYTESSEDLSIPALLMELYRVKQMMEDDSLSEDIRFELQFRVFDIVDIVGAKVHDKSFYLKLSKLRSGEVTTEDLIFELAAIGNRYHMDLISNIVIGIEFLQGADIFDIRHGFERDEFKGKIQAVVEELKLLFSYFPHETEKALEDIAYALMASGMTKNAKLFTSMFNVYCPSQAKRAENLKSQVRLKNVISVAEMAKLVRLTIDQFSSGCPLDAKILQRIKMDQGFRCILLIMLNEHVRNNISFFSTINWDTLIKMVFENMENPYEIYHFFKSLTTSSATEGVSITPEVLTLGADRFAEFFQKGMDDQIIDVLTRTDKQFITMKDFIKFGFDSSSELRKQISRLYVDGNGLVSAYMYQYIKYYLMYSDKLGMSGRSEQIHEILIVVLEGLLKNGDQIDTVKFRRMLELFAAASDEINGIKLDREWKVVIEKFKRGEISKENLLNIERNAQWMMDDVCLQMVDERKIRAFREKFAIRDLNGLSIFNQAILEKAAEDGKREQGQDAYFGEMAQDEINPQIKRILEDSTEKNYNFVIGSTTEFKYGRLKLPDGAEDKIKRAYKMVNSMYSGRLSAYSVAVLRGVNFSGHYGESRQRIYIPLEILELTTDNLLLTTILEDLIEHEYLHSIGWDEEKIIKHSNEIRPGVYEKVRELYIKYIAGKLQGFVQETMGLSIETGNIEAILKRIQEGKRIELNETQINRLLWLINRSKGFNLVPEIADLIQIILEPNYTGDVTEVIMALEKAILAEIYTEEQLARQNISVKLSAMQVVEKGKILIKPTIAGLRFEGPELPERVKDTLQYVHNYGISVPSDIKEKHYVLIDEYRAREYKEIIEEVSKTYGVEFITDLNTIPENVNREEVVVLVDPEDTERYKGYLWYLPLIYNKKSFVMAALLSIEKPDRYQDLKNTNILRFVKGFYSEFLKGEDLKDEDVIAWFEKPWILQDRLKKYSGDLKFLRIAFTQLDISA